MLDTKEFLYTIASSLLGREHRPVGAPDSIVTANPRWLAGYRHPQHAVAAGGRCRGGG